jgi:hypothetical protein
LLGGTLVVETWKDLLTAAVCESDDAKFQERLDAAESAIIEQLGLLTKSEGEQFQESDLQQTLASIADLRIVTKKAA